MTRSALLESKFGRCPKCMALSFGLTGVSGVVVFLGAGTLPVEVIGVTAGAFGVAVVFAFTHILGVAMRRVDTRAGGNEQEAERPCCGGAR